MKRFGLRGALWAILGLAIAATFGTGYLADRAEASPSQLVYPNIAALQALGTASPFVGHAYVQGYGALDWIAGACTPDNQTSFAATGGNGDPGLPTTGTGAGCWVTSRASFMSITQMLSAYGSGDQPPLFLHVASYGANDTNGLANGWYEYDPTITANFTITASASYGYNSRIITVTNVPSGFTIKAGMSFTAPSGCTDERGQSISTELRNRILPYGWGGTSGTGGNGTYFVYFGWTCPSGSSIPVTWDNGGTIRVDAAGHGFRLVPGQDISFNRFGSDASTQSVINAHLQNALTDWYWRACQTGVGEAGESADLVGYRNSSYHTTQPLYAGHDGYSTEECESMRLVGKGIANNGGTGGALLSGAGFASVYANSPVLEAPGMALITCDNFWIQSQSSGGLGAFGIGQIPITPGNLNSGVETTIDAKGCGFDASLNSSAHFGALFQQSDTSKTDSFNSFLAPPSGFDAVAFGTYAPAAQISGSWGQIVAVTDASHFQLAANASTTSNIFANHVVIVCQTNSYGECTGTQEAGFITSYNGSTQVVTLMAPLSGFTPTTNSTYYILDVASAFEPLAYTGTQGAETHMDISAREVRGAMHFTGAGEGSPLDFKGVRFFSRIGTNATVLLVDAGNMCVPGFQADFGYAMNTENDGATGDTLVWFRGGGWAQTSIIAGGRLWMGNSGDAYLRANASDINSTPCHQNHAYGPSLSTVHLVTSSLVGTPLVDFDGPGSSQEFTPSIASLILDDVDVGGHYNAATIAGNTPGTNTVAILGQRTYSSTTYTAFLGNVQDRGSVASSPDVWKAIAQNCSIAGKDCAGRYFKLLASASYTMACADIGEEFDRSNSGSAMTDTLPPAACPAWGYGYGYGDAKTITETNYDTTANLTVSVPSGSQINLTSGGAVTSVVIPPGRSMKFEMISANGTVWQAADNSDALALFSPNTTQTAGHIITARDGHGGVQDSGIASSSVATGPSSATSGDLPSFNGTGGKTLQDSGVSAASVATGPSSATSGDLPSFNGTGGKTLQDSGVAASSVATGPSSATSGDLPSFNGTGGKTLQDSGVAASSVSTASNSQTLTNKTISGASNTFSAIPGSALNSGSVANSALANSSITVGGQSVSLGGSVTTLTPIMGSMNSDTAGSTVYSSVMGSGQSTTTIGSREEVAPFAFHLTTWNVTRSSAPGSAYSATYTLQDVTQSTSLACTISNTATTCGTTGNLAVSAGDLLVVSDALSSGGTVANAAWGATGTVP